MDLNFEIVERQDGKYKTLYIYEDNKLIAESSNSLIHVAVPNSHGLCRVDEYTGQLNGNISEKRNIPLAILKSEFSRFPNDTFINTAINVSDLTSLKTYVSAKKVNDNIVLYVGFHHDVENWDYPFSPVELNEYISSKPGSYYCPYDNQYKLQVVFSCELPHENGSEIIIDRVYPLIERFSATYHESLASLSQGKAESIFVKLFEFPVEYSNICSQYLMWFGEFLGNLGIEADVHTDSNRGKTALIVAPTDAPGLLEEIEKYFYQYLSLPYVELLPSENQAPQEAYAYQAAINQVQFLQSQLQMKESALMLEKATNLALMDQVTQQKTSLLLLESLQGEKKYDFFDGFISIPAKHSFGKNKNITLDFSKVFNRGSK